MWSETAGFPKKKDQLYPLLISQLSALVEGIPHPIANLANASALLKEALEDVNWAGFYLLQGEKLVLGPFQGRPACIEIQVGKGVCGSAVAQNQPLLVEDVHQFAGHIACDSASRSEIVLPFYKNGAIAGVLDIDSPLPARFDEEDLAGLEQFVRVLERAL
ncbi:MAG: GAF domain-containing protein [Oscillospiraceae bacterium]|nr:GAF domain-containing protein [Oscillospiraceae bacterium]